MSEDRRAGDAEPAAAAPVSFHAMASGAAGTSAAGAYRALVLGRPGLWPWLRYELLVSTLTFKAGAAGLALRRRFFPKLFARCGRRVVFGCGIQLRQPDRMIIGERSVLDDYSAMGARGGTGIAIELDERVFVGRGTVVNTRDGRISVGADTSIGSFCRLAAGAGGDVRIGRYGLIAAFCYIGGGAHRFDRTDVPMALQGNVSKGGVTIGDDCWIGAGTIVRDGARIGEGCVIGAGSLVIGEIPPYSVAFGRPARVQRSRGPAAPNTGRTGESAV